VELIRLAESSVELMSDSQLQSGLQAISPDGAMESEILSIYSAARTRAFQAGMSFLVFISLIGLVMTTGLRKRKLVDS